MARIEDITMNILVADSSQVYNHDDWQTKLNIPFRDTGNGIKDNEVSSLNRAVDMDALWTYRTAVGMRTRCILRTLQPQDFIQEVDPLRIQNIYDQGSMRENARGITEYWSRRTIAGLLLMPPTRHNFIHLNEAKWVKKR